MPRRHARPHRVSLWGHIGRIFLTGLLTVLPIIATIYFTIWLLAVLERFFGKQVLFLIPDEWYRTGMGLAVAVVVVFLVGVLMHGILFRRLFGWAERLLLGVPLVRSVYAALRDLLGLFAEHKEPSLQVVTLELPGNLRVYTVFVPKSACTPIDMSREEAMKFILTAGLKSASPAIDPPGESYDGRRPS
jgi:uncharacterized membrane protein